MSVAAETLEQYEGKKIVLVRRQGDGAEELEGTAEKANAVGVLFKPKGKSKADIISPEEIEDIRLAPDSIPALKRKALKPVVLGQARSHLLERHGYTLAQVNALTEDDAFVRHGEIDHVASDLGHIHEDKSSTPVGQATADEEDTES